MDKEQINIQKKLSLFISIVGFLVVIIYIVNLLATGYSLKLALIEPAVILIFMFSSIFFLSRKSENILIPIMQVSIIYLNGVLSILDDHEAFNGFGFIILFVLMLYKYKMLNKFTIIKLIAISASVIILIEISLAINTDFPIGQSFIYIIYFIFFFTIVYILYSSEFKRILKAENKFKKSLQSKEDELQVLFHDINDHKAIIENKEIRISELCSEIDDLKESWNPIDLSQYKITQREESIIKILCLNTELANKEIAAKLGISEGTIKQNMNKIFKKLGIANRQKMIELCQNNFVSNPRTNSAKNA